MNSPTATSSQFDAKNFLSNISSRPGVYRMQDATGKVIYVGKAKNLKKRLGSYFRASGLDTKTLALVARINNIEVTITHSETEALLLEHNLIKSLRPPYNIQLRDDKSYPYIFLSQQSEFPRLSLHRGSHRRKGKYFGPFPSAGAVRESLAILQKVFKVRQCEDSFFKNRTRPCLQYQIKRCTAPCVNLVAVEDYQQQVHYATLFLQGKNDAIMQEFSKQMELCAEQQNYEKAATLRDQISDLRQIQEQQYVSGEQGDVDVIAVSSQAGTVCVHIVFVRAGRVLGSKSYFPKYQIESRVEDVLSAFIGQFYLSQTDNHNIPKELIVNVALADKENLSAGLQHLAQRKVAISKRVRGHRLKWLTLATINAEQSLASYLANKQNMRKRFENLQDLLALEAMPQRIECFDISHTSGEATVASCVVFDSNGPLKSDYRRFNIKGIKAGDDYGAMQQALMRRYTRLQSGEGKLPDLLLIDGGKGQLSQAEKVMQECQVSGLQLMAIAKGISRKAGQETLFLSLPDDKVKEVVVAEESAALHLLQHIRDEAHRFAITGHRQRRDNKRKQSLLEGIPGVGPKKRRELLRFFGGKQEIQRASLEALSKVPGISKKLAEEIYTAMHNG